MRVRIIWDPDSTSTRRLNYECRSVIIKRHPTRSTPNTVEPADPACHHRSYTVCLMPDKGTYVVVAPKSGGTSHRAAARRGSTNAFSSAVNASILGTLPFCARVRGLHWSPAYLRADNTRRQTVNQWRQLT